MPRIKHITPKYRLHKPTGQAVVTLDGWDHYLGKHGTQASRQQYDLLIAEWLANGRRMPVESEDTGLLIDDLIERFFDHANVYYRKPDGTPTSAIDSFEQAVAPLQELYGQTQAMEFGPLALKAVRQAMIDRGWNRVTVNNQTARIKQIFKWGVENELVPANVYHGLQAVSGLKRGRSEARETDPVKPVPQAFVDAVIPHVSPQVGAMIQLQVLTGMRPGEVVSMRGVDIDTTGEVWVYQPADHKTAHHGHERLIYLGPQAKEIVRRFWRPNLTEFLFQAREGEKVHRRRREQQRVTPRSCGNRRGSNRKKKPGRKPGECYTTASYRRAIERGCDLAFPPPKKLQRIRVKAKKGMRWEEPKEWRERLGEELWAELRQWQRDHRWHPHQLRHNAATELRKKFGLEAARVVLGHRSAAVTEMYAEIDRMKAAQIMGEVG